ncbi:MAG: hypothetical protein ACJ72N_07525 [Labedaea sp.]|jgi:hypothetical protein
MYLLNPEAARAGDNVGGYISESGKYVGKFLRAEKLVAKEKQTDGIGFTFRAEDGREARFDAWTQKADGTALPGLNTINALMTCLQLRELRATPQRVKRYDYEQQQNVEQVVPCFDALMNTDIGVLLRAEEYEKMQGGQPTGETGWKMNLYAVFQAKTGLMATEILARRTSPEMLNSVLLSLKDKPLRKKAAPASAPASAPGSVPFLDDDVPF